MIRFDTPSMVAVAIVVVAAAGLILVSSSAFQEGPSISAGWQSGLEDGVTGLSEVEDGAGKGVEDSTTGFVALGIVLSMLAMVSRLLCTLYESPRPCNISDSVLEWPD